MFSSVNEDSAEIVVLRARDEGKKRLGRTTIRPNAIFGLLSK